MNKYESADEQVRTVHNHEVIITRLQLQVQQMHQQLHELELIVVENVDQIGKISLILDRMTE